MFSLTAGTEYAPPASSIVAQAIYCEIRCGGRGRCGPDVISWIVKIVGIAPGKMLEEKIRNFPVEDLAKQVPGRNYPYETLFHGVVEHTIYHSGQIAMVLSMLRSRSLPENP